MPFFLTIRTLVLSRMTTWLSPVDFYGLAYVSPKLICGNSNSSMMALRGWALGKLLGQRTPPHVSMGRNERYFRELPGTSIQSAMWLHRVHLLLPFHSLPPCEDVTTSTSTKQRANLHQTLNLLMYWSWTPNLQHYENQILIHNLPAFGIYYFRTNRLRWG
jgi:hypothetical protein